MPGKIGLFILTLLVAAGCAAQPAAVMPTPPATAATTLAPGATLSEHEALALADKFYDLLVTQQDYAGAIGLFDDAMKAALPEDKLKEIWTT